MSVQERKERERAGRQRLIVATARELAEQQGWDAVTTRRLAERIEYSQPVLYSHFRGKREIIGAVALEGAAELAAAVRAATAAADGPRERVYALARAYLDFAAGNPAVYDAIFQLDGGLAYAQEDTPEPLKDAFAARRTPSRGWSCWWTGSAWSDAPSRRVWGRGSRAPLPACGSAFGHSRPHGAPQIAGPRTPDGHPPRKRRCSMITT
ncbi:TetR/AcrR family transcriptional regulator [Streptomyces cellulosae]|uniref:TetR/AcrR family transcriptional regulator n=1 Tax=Streptomyces cellulosae TaxID=1968 RepID=UPI000A976C79|nr:TetR/AcrR family transcriptional regulator [Streptomyces cellulosae]